MCYCYTVFAVSYSAEEFKLLALSEYLETTKTGEYLLSEEYLL